MLSFPPAESGTFAAVIQRGVFVLLLAVVIADKSLAGSVDPLDFQLEIADATAEVASPVTTSVTLTNTSGFDVRGWTFGVCHDSNFLEISQIANGVATQALNGGAGPQSNFVTMVPGEGWTVGVIVSVLGNDVLPPGSNLELNTATYDMNSVLGTTEICFCATLGPGPVHVIFSVNGNSRFELSARPQ